MFNNTVAQTKNPNEGDIEVANAPEDTVSSLSFSPYNENQLFMAATSWAGDVRVWELNLNGQVIPKSSISNPSNIPMLHCNWHNDGTKIFIAGSDVSGRVWDLQSNQLVEVAKHEAPVRTVHWIERPTFNCLMTTSWDQTVKFWDLRSPQPLETLNLSGKSYCADAINNMGVVATSDKKIHVINMDPRPTLHSSIQTPLRMQSRCISIFCDPRESPQTRMNPIGYALGSIEARMAIQLVDPSNQKGCFTFKCHRNTIDDRNIHLYAVNGVAFHPLTSTFCTIGSDGRYNLWDKDARAKLKGSDPVHDQPLTACGIDPSGRVLAFASGYDWSKGYEHFNPNKNKTRIYIRPCMNEMKPKRT
ncbi:hypothetical protein SNEBB_008507 [Seison nebaliae]|nr:hypothetical protein SNEBB_008507 [Seison nebaliae]